MDVISPAPLRSHEPDYLPAYLANGLVGLRVREIPVLSGVCVVSGLSGLDPVDDIEGTPFTPYPLALDIAIGRVWFSRIVDSIRPWEQRYDFSRGELHSHFEATVGDVRATVDMVTFCSRTEPSLVCQEVTLRVDRKCEVSLRGGFDTSGAPGQLVETVAGSDPVAHDTADCALVWEARGGRSKCGMAYSTEIAGPDDDRAGETDYAADAQLRTTRTFTARPGHRYRLRQTAAVVGDIAHDQPDRQAVRLLRSGCDVGFDELRRRNAEEWSRLWRSRAVLHGADREWQALADSAFFYLHSSVHSSSVSSTHLFGLSRWLDYHYYYGHVMWDLEVFALPAVLLVQPLAARALLDYRSRNLTAAEHNARLNGQSGVQFPWESEPRRGEEATPLGGNAPHYAQHVSLGIARGFAQFVHATGDVDFLREHAWPVLKGVAEFIVGIAVRSPRGYEIRQTMGVAELEKPSDNVAYVNMSAAVALREAAAAARRVGIDPPDEWTSIADELVLPIRDDGVVVLHDGYDPSEPKAETPGPLAGIFPGGYELAPDVERATIDFFLSRWKDYVGNPMLSALYGAWAARIGDREQAARLLDEGYAKFVSPRFMNVHEWRDDHFPDKPPAGPFFANLGGFLLDCYYGFPGLSVTAAQPERWCTRPVVLPAGWDCIEVERLYARGGAWHLVAEHGAENASLSRVD